VKLVVIEKTSSTSEDDEYKVKTYDDLSSEFQKLYLFAARALQLIPIMYNRLTLVDRFSHKEAFTKICDDHGHLDGFSDRNIRRYLPLDNPSVPRRVRTSRPKSSRAEINDHSKSSDAEHESKSSVKTANPFTTDHGGIHTVSNHGSQEGSPQKRILRSEYDEDEYQECNENLASPNQEAKNKEVDNESLGPSVTVDTSIIDSTSSSACKTHSQRLELNNQVNQDLKECSSCKELYCENLELKEALRRQTLFTKAEEIPPYEIVFTIPKEKFPNLNEAMQRSKDAIYVIFDKSGILECAVAETMYDNLKIHH
jgi:hypothetical protein